MRGERMAEEEEEGRKGGERKTLGIVEMGAGQRGRAKRDIKIEGAIMELAINVALGKFPGIH